MAYEIEKGTGDIVISGFEQGIGHSPHKGLGNIQNANLNTETGEVINSFVRTQNTMTNTASSGTLSFLSTDHVNLSITNTNNLFKGNWIIVSNSSNTGQLPNGTYYVPPSTGAGFQLSNYYNTANYIPATVNVSALVVAGGGGGSGGTNQSNVAGGGGGQVVSVAAFAAQINSYAIVVGTGGAQNTAGTNSSVFGNTAIGGLAGSAQTGGNSGSGKLGGTGGLNGSSGYGGGGAGDSANGLNGSSPAGVQTGGNGGNGTASSISGSSVTYGDGGGGGGYSNSGALASFGGTGGSGNGGHGGFSTGTGVIPATSGVANTGSGGGGAGGAIATTSGGSGSDGIVYISYPTGSMTATGGTITTSGGNTIHKFTANGTFQVTAFPTVTVAPVLTGFTAGLTATIQMLYTMGSPVAKATETYFRNGVTYYRYYILDNQNLVWVYDDYNETIYSSSDGVSWFLPDTSTTWCTKATGIGVISGFLIGATEHGLFGKSVATLGNTNSATSTWVQFPDFNGWQGSLRSTSTPHFCYVGHQGAMYITDASYIVEVFPDVTIANTASTSNNIQSFDTWVANSQFVATTTIISGASLNTTDGKRVPVVLFAQNNSVLPTALSTGIVYYAAPSVDGTFNLYTAATGGSPLDLQTGGSGTLYLNTFYPLAAASSSSGSNPTWVLSGQRVSLPKFEVAQCMAEVGNLVLIGCQGNSVYPWDQIQNLPSDVIPLPESNTTTILTVNKMGYIFVGNKGNIYITDGSVTSAVTTVPDYTAGISGTPTSYIEPYFVWGGADYIRGKVYFSILDQTTTKTGNCGGVWSFTPTQNFYIGQDIGIGLHLENQSSYGSYNGYSPIIIAKQQQKAIAPQYFNAWISDISSPTYGIDSTGTTSAQSAIIETDAIPTGTMFNKNTFKQIEFKLSTPALVADSVILFYRKNLTDVWKSLGTISMEPDRISGYLTPDFEKSQWTQLRIILTPSSSSFLRFKEIRLR